MPLTLVKPHAGRHPRPWTTHYYGSPKDSPQQWAAVGHSASKDGAIAAAILRILRGRARLALIRAKFGPVEVRIRLSAGRIAVEGDL